MYTSTVLNSVVLLAYIVIKLNYFWYVQKITGVTLFFLVELVLFIFIFFCVVLCFCVLSVFVLCLVCPMLPVSLDCLSSSCVLCAQCCQCLWIVCLRPVSCVPNIASLSGLSILWFSLTSVCSNTHQLPLFGRGLRYSSSQEPYI